MSVDHPGPVPTPPPPGGTPVPPGMPPPRRGAATAVVAGLTGLVIGALVASGVWWLAGGTGDGGSSEPITAPDTIGDYVRFADATVTKENERGREHARRWAQWNERSAQRLSESHGAGATVEQYTNQDLDEMFSLLLVRAKVPFPPYVAYSDPEELGLERPLEEVRRYGEVACAVRNDHGGETRTMRCVRTSADLTVEIRPSGPGLGEGPEHVAGLVDDAWARVA